MKRSNFSQPVSEFQGLASFCCKVWALANLPQQEFNVLSFLVSFCPQENGTKKKKNLWTHCYALGHIPLVHALILVSSDCLSQGASTLPWRPEANPRRSGETKGPDRREERGTRCPEEGEWRERGPTSVGDQRAEGATEERQGRAGKGTQGGEASSGFYRKQIIPKQPFKCLKAVSKHNDQNSISYSFPLFSLQSSAGRTVVDSSGLDLQEENTRLRERLARMVLSPFKKQKKRPLYTCTHAKWCKHKTKEVLPHWLYFQPWNVKLKCSENIIPLSWFYIIHCVCSNTLQWLKA